MTSACRKSYEDGVRAETIGRVIRGEYWTHLEV